MLKMFQRRPDINHLQKFNGEYHDICAMLKKNFCYTAFSCACPRAYPHTDTKYLRNIIVSLILYKSLAGLLIFLTSAIAVAYPIKVQAHPKHNRILELGDAFASGIFLGAALFHMLPDAIYSFKQVMGDLTYPLPELFCAAGFLILLFFER